MSRYKKHTVEKAGDWSVETPDMDNYKMACCDCGLVHDLKFRAIEVVEGDPKGKFGYVDLDPEKYRVEIQVRRNNRATGQMRRRMK